MYRLLPAALLLAACGTSVNWQAAPRPVAKLPPAFAPDAAFHGAGAQLSPAACLSHLQDPTWDVRLELVRSDAGLGDYRVLPNGRYGVAANELLRVTCATGVPRGAVPR